MKPTRITITTLTAALALLLGGCGTWVQYPEDYQPPSTATLDDLPAVDHLDHLVFDALLAEYSEPGEDAVLVDYDALAAGGEATWLLDQYLAMLNSVDATQLTDRDERLAYWINGYNAAVIRGVTLRYEGDPGFSVLDGGTFFEEASYGFGGVVLSLNQLEHGVLRGAFDNPGVQAADADTLAAIEVWHEQVWEGEGIDPRIHTAINCASLGCPSLRATQPLAYRPALLDEQLDAASTEFCNDDDKGAGPDGISRIFDWYGVDFDDADGVDGFIETYRDGGLAGVDLDSWLPYDWSLNIVAP